MKGGEHYVQPTHKAHSQDHRRGGDFLALRLSAAAGRVLPFGNLVDFGDSGRVRFAGAGAGASLEAPQMVLNPAVKKEVEAMEKSKQSRHTVHTIPASVVRVKAEWRENPDIAKLGQALIHLARHINEAKGNENGISEQDSKEDA